MYSCYKDRPLKVLQSEKLCLVIETRKTTKRGFCLQKDGRQQRSDERYGWESLVSLPNLSLGRLGGSGVLWQNTEGYRRIQKKTEDAAGWREALEPI